MPLRANAPFAEKSKFFKSLVLLQSPLWVLIAAFLIGAALVGWSCLINVHHYSVTLDLVGRWLQSPDAKAVNLKNVHVNAGFVDACNYAFWYLFVCPFVYLLAVYFIRSGTSALPEAPSLAAILWSRNLRIAGIMIADTSGLKR